MAAKWVQRLKERLKINPLFWDRNELEVKCLACGGKGKKVPLYAITNYSHWHTCNTCGTRYT
jgi:hypothetical protein